MTVIHTIRPTDQPRCLAAYVSRTDDRLAYNLWRMTHAGAPTKLHDICMSARDQLRVAAGSALDNLQRGYPLSEAHERMLDAAQAPWPAPAPCSWRSRDW